MAVLEIAIEIGTSNTSIYISGMGVVLREPTIVAFIGEPKQRKVRAVGNQAIDMLGKTPEKTTIVSPVMDGFIVDQDACTVLLKEFIKKIIPDKYIFNPRIKAILGVPTGLTVEERKMYEDVCLKAGVSDVTMIENIILSAIGIDLPISTTNGGVIVNIGGGTTEIAALSLSGVVSGCGVNIGGTMMDKALLDFIVGKYSLKIGLSTARKVKTEIGSLYSNDTSYITVSGIDVRTKNLGSVTIRATDVLEALMPYYIRVSEAIESVINMCPPEIASDIYKSGIHVTGGASQILGLDKLFGSRLKLPVYVSEDANFSTITGAGKLLSNKQLLEEILIQK